MSGFVTRILERSVGRTSYTVSDFLFLGGAAAVAALFFVFGTATFRGRGDDSDALVYALMHFAVALAVSCFVVAGVVLWLREWLRSWRMKP